MYGRGMSVRDIQAHLRELYGVEVGHDLISRVTDAVLDDVREWQARPLEDVYPILFLDALIVKVRDGGAVRNKACYVAIGVNLEGERDVLGLWFQSSEGAKFWLAVLNELKQRGVRDVLICCVDVLNGFPEAIEAVFPQAWVQTCIVHLIRQSLRFVPDKHRRQVAKDLRPIYTAVDADAAAGALAAFETDWGERYPMIGKTWRETWEYVIPFLAFPAEVRRVVYTTDESVKSPVAAPVVESGWARVTPDQRAGRGDGCPAAQDCRLTASESHPSGGTRARSLARFRLPVGDELAVAALAVLAEGAFSSPHLLQVVGVGGAALAAA
jgi:putative transposase